MKTILVTGINGFVGRHLARELSGRGLKIIGIGNQEPVADPEIVGLLEGYFKCDITQADQVSKLDLSKVTCIINLAGLANVGASFNNPELYMRINVDVLRVLGGELLRQNPNAKMIAVSTGALYDPNQTMPLSEKSLTITGGSPYALSKLAMEKSADALRKKGLNCIVVRPFNHIGPGQGIGFLIPDLVQRLKNMDKSNPLLTVGNIKTVRDYTDVRDIVKAYVDLAVAENLSHNLYNVCSGKTQSGEDIIRCICKNLSIDYEKIRVKVDESLIRPSDPKIIFGDNSRLREATGWEPNIELDKTIRDTIEAI